MTKTQNPKFIFICCLCGAAEDAAAPSPCCGWPMQPIIDSKTQTPITAASPVGREILRHIPPAVA